jgi:superfamily II DNA or RNA helicase
VPTLPSIALRRRYSSGRHDLTAEFFAPCLQASEAYDRAVGFFSSSFYVLVGVPIADFARRGGKMRLVCSPRLSPEDITAIEDGYAQRAAGTAVLRELELELQDPTGAAAARLLATLVAAGCVDIKIAFKPSGQGGLFHDKVGIFTDVEKSKVSFTGSANETWAAWSGRANHEYFHAFASWVEGDTERVADDVSYFESLWDGHEPDLLILDFPDVARERLEEIVDPEGSAAAEERLQILAMSRPPRPVLRDHQSAALDQWRAASYRGILEHATGSGKTITALSCIDEAFTQAKVAIVLVPSRTLLRQWHGEAKAFFGDEADVLLVGGGHDEWRVGSLLRDFLSAGQRRLVIATMDTAATEQFVSRAADLPELILVADEVHRVGSPTRRRALTIDADWRLGLSATWEREGDPGGSAAILDYFEHVLEPPYTLHDAIRDGHLCSYRYIVHTVELNSDERERWLALSARIGRAIASADGEFTEQLRHLLIQRARIVKAARAKVPAALDVLNDRYTPGEAWLVYCDDSEQLAALRAACVHRGLHTFEYHTNMTGDATAALDEFARSGGIMLSINCLDEGVDIPRISHALILASSTTRREFIQRRGRVLRQHDSKHRAVIHDMLVDAGGFDDTEAARFVRSELARAWEFLQSATDSSAARVILARLADQAGVDLDDPTVARGVELDETTEDE